MAYASGLDINVVMMKKQEEKREPEKKKEQMRNPLHGHDGGGEGGEERWEGEAWRSMK